jgi:hypothetical protein
MSDVIAGTKGKKAKEEFLVFAVGQNIKVGASITLLAITNTEKDAATYVEKIAGTSPERVVVAEKKNIFVRKPKVEVIKVEENILE